MGKETKVRMTENRVREASREEGRECEGKE